MHFLNFYLCSFFLSIYLSLSHGCATRLNGQHIPQYCGSCYAHGSLSMLNDRIKIMNMKRGHAGTDVMLGRQTFLNCAPFLNFGNGCHGGEPADIFNYMRDVGLPDETCMHYSASDHTALGIDTSTLTRCPKISECMNCFIVGEPFSHQRVCTHVTFQVFILFFWRSFFICR